MFLSWKQSGEGNGAIHTKLPMTFDPVKGKTQSPQACAGCRARKVKCIWDGGGCERCKTAGRECIYEATRGGNSTRRKSRHDASGPGASTKSIKRARTTDESADPAEPLSTNQSSQDVSAAETATVQTSGSSCDDTELLCMSSPSTETIFVDSNLDASMLDMNIDLDADTTNSFNQEISTDLIPMHGVTLGDLVQWTGEPWSSTTPSLPTPVSEFPSCYEGKLSDGNPCQCLRRLVILVDEIESIAHRNILNSPDRALAAQKEAIGCGTEMMDCTACTSRVENMIILTLMVDKLVQTCNQLAEACCAELKNKPPGTKTPRLSLQSNTEVASHSLGHGGPEMEPNSPSRVYSINSSVEYFFVMAGILRFQLLELFNLTQQLQIVVAPLASDTIGQRLKMCTEAVKDLLNRAGLTPLEAPEGTGTLVM
ncbi:hypothetical protein F5B22DRAFT_610507 [Xylaria bambusicola]|uniref:uncharacterized protein n=1 Tax=Xylaria bambusicola TaxID=326684 RepID=UPI0020078AD1|nr:uncharacterized protein F5B22DRAFT_610507 [Xylaria bambusicola]KAI0514716.1 hypothetical protein F5B22DRAFT_610507 [Xylaria bambusicola]